MVLCELHRFLKCFLVQLKVLVIVYKALCCLRPWCLKECILSHEPVCMLWYSSKALLYTLLPTEVQVMGT